jgi:hypothetical protein
MRKNIDEFALPQQSGYTFSIENDYRVLITDPQEKVVQVRESISIVQLRWLMSSLPNVGRKQNR